MIDFCFLFLDFFFLRSGNDEQHGSLSGPGFWADAQQLEVCNFGEGNEFASPNVSMGMTLEEYRSHYSIWAMFASPMVLSANLATLATRHPDCLAMIKNTRLLSIARDSGATPGLLIHQATNMTATVRHQCAAILNPEASSPTFPLMVWFQFPGVFFP